MESSSSMLLDLDKTGSLGVGGRHRQLSPVIFTAEVSPPIKVIIKLTNYLIFKIITNFDVDILVK